VWVAEFVLLVDPSPKFHANEYGVVPPVAVAVKVTGWFAIGGVGLKLNVTASGAITVKVKVAEEALAPAGAPVTRTVHVPAVAVG